MNPLAQRSVILEEIITFQDIVRLKQSLDSAIAKLFDTKISLDEVLTESFTHDEVTILKSELNKLGFIQNIPKIQQYLTEIKVSLSSFPVIEVELAYRPVEIIEKSILQNLKASLGQDVILHIIVNPHIVAGAILHFRGKTHDYSFQKEIESFFSHTE